MKNILLLKKSLTFLIGLFVMALAVSMSVIADLGVSPISSIPYVYSLQFPYTIGEITIVFNMLLLLGQIILLRKKFQLFQLVQFPIVFLFGYFIDLTLAWITPLSPEMYVGKMIWCLAACVVLAIGVFFEVEARITFLPGEGMVMAMVKTFNLDFGKTKIATDSFFVVVGVISSFLFFGSLKGIREGTVIAALLVGYIVRILSKNFNFLGRFVEAEEEKLEEKTIASTNNLIITISREFGSGGHEIGKAVAKKLGIGFYDKELIKLSSEKGGFTEEYIKQHEQKLAHSLLDQLYEQNYAYTNATLPPLEALFLVQSKIIREISEKESCVIVGRCANFVLKDRPNCFNVFIHANKDFRKQRVINEFGFDDATASKKMEETFKGKVHYCKHYTNNEWGDVDNYHLTLDASVLGIEKVVDMITEMVSPN